MIKDRRFLLYLSLVLIALLAVLHFLAIFLYFYWIYWWFDWVMHFLAGVAGGLATYWVLAESDHFPKMRPTTYIWFVFLSVMIVGVAWEVFEYTNGIIDDTHEGYALDTSIDLVLDGLGAWLAAFVGIKISSAKND